jgi:hypothetical protein
VVSLSSPDQATTAFTSPNEDNILVFTLSVEDNLGGVDSDTVSVFAQGATTSIDENILANKVKLFGNHPNPFNPKTDIVFQVLNQTKVEVSIYNVYGQKIWTKNIGLVNKGVYSIPWQGKNAKGEPVVSGVYFYQIIAGDRWLINKMSLVK